jgi:hypothetical protein
MIMKTMLPILTVLLILVGCKKYDSADIGTDEIRQNYTVKYYSGSNTTEVESQFTYKRRGNTVLLSGSAGIQYAGQSLPYTGRGSYSSFMNGNLLGNSFQFTDNTGQVYVNSTPIVNPLNVSFNNALYMDRTQPFSLTISNVVGHHNDSRYRLYLGSREYIGYRTYNNRLEFNLSVADMANLNAGYHFANLSHSRTVGLAQGTGAGGNITVEYLSPDFQVYVY